MGGRGGGRRFMAAIIAMINIHVGCSLADIKRRFILHFTLMTRGRKASALLRRNKRKKNIEPAFQLKLNHIVYE